MLLTRRSDTERSLSRGPRRAVATGLALGAGLAASTAMAPAADASGPLACPHQKGTNHYLCSWYTAGNGKTAGTPVQAANGTRVGFLHQGQNWIVCQQRGSRVTKGKNTNVWWGFTTADNGKTGWSNAVYAKGGKNDGIFGSGVPNCNNTHGSAPVTKSTPKPPTKPPVTGPSRATLAAAVKAVAYERVYGPNYGRYKRKFPQTAKPNTIIWEKDGCSAPQFGGVVGKVVKKYGKTFQKSCDRHDFGYRNYGSVDGGLALDNSEKRRASIDSRFQKNMVIQCDKTYDDGFPSPDVALRKFCHGAAKVFYLAVRNYGADDFR